MQNKNRPIAIWLLTGCLLIFLMVAIGGMTRLTHSGLSMVEWNMFIGSTPPGSEVEWEELFDKYKQYPEYKLVNFNIDLEEFKSIYFWEYSHRLFGRMIGLVFIIPFLWFWIKGKIGKSLMPKLLLILSMGAFQGFLGWYMVKSGLVKEPDVSHYRLAAHLITAFITFAYTFWVALDLLDVKKLQRANYPINRYLKVLLLLVIVQIVWGAYVAGLNAGKIYNSWPKMGEDWVADSVVAMKPLWINFVEGMAGVQFIHRYLAYAVVALILFIFYKGKRSELIMGQTASLNILLSAVILQFVLGVFTLIHAVPIGLGLLHQLGAFLLLGSVVFAMHKFKLPTVASST